MPRNPRVLALLALLAPACAGGPRQQAQALRAPSTISPVPPVSRPPAAVTDRDGDGLVDASDACPDEPGVDGCPIPDSDGDGTLDPDDRCPSVPETRNGYQDEDGCPDAIPSKLAAFTGSLKGVSFGGEGRRSPVSAPDRPEPLEWVHGASPAMNTEKYARRVDHPFIAVSDDPRSTFSIDVDTASYTNVRRFLSAGQRPPADAVRIEEMINYFAYDYPAPTGDDAFSLHSEVAACPWNRAHQLVRIGIKGKVLAPDRMPAKNLVFLIDVSGSMADADKLPLLKTSLNQLVDTLTARDRVGIVVYAGAAGVVLAPTAGDRKHAIRAALNRLTAGGSTAGGAGIAAAYKMATEGFVKGGVNRVILATDGDFNVGQTSEGELTRLIEEKRETGVFLTALGFGRGNLADATMEALADKGNGNYAYIDSATEAEKVLVREAAGTLITIAKDVKLQVEFNPTRVGSYRLIGYENRALAHRDFKDDRKDAGEIGVGHTVTAFYEVVPRGQAPTTDSPGPDPLKYQAAASPTAAAASSELMTVAIRHKQPAGATSREQRFTVADPGPRALAGASDDFRFGAAVAMLGLLLRKAPRRGQATVEQVLELARGAVGVDPHGDRRGFIALAEAWQDLPRIERARRAEEAAYRREHRHALAAAQVTEARMVAAERRARRRSPAQALAEAGKLPREAAPLLQRSAQMLREFTTIRVEISGHSDSAEGRSDDERLALSQARAEAVRKHLVEQEGIAADRIELRAAGSTEPVDTNKTALGRARNRRTEFTILTQ